MSRSAGPPCGNSPNFRMSDGDLAERRQRESEPSVEPAEDNGVPGICDCGREKQPSENHSMCHPGMD